MLEKLYFLIDNKLVPFIYGGMSRQKLDIISPLPITSIDQNRDTNLITSSDYFYGLLALGEGPVYSINPNGPTDIEFNDASIDDLIDYSTNKTDNTKLYVLSSKGDILQPSSLEFNSYFGRTVSPQALSSTVQLRKGNLPGIPQVKIVQNTTQYKWDALEFNFSLNGLFALANDGSVGPKEIGVRISITDHLGIGSPFIINPDGRSTFVEAKHNGVSQTPVKFTVKVEIPPENRSEFGYQFTVEKITDDDDSSKVSEQIGFAGWDEITYEDYTYPRTAMLGVVLKSFAEYSSSVPTITSLVKGLLVKVPSNYNQPILVNKSSKTIQVTVPVDNFDTIGSSGYTVPAGTTQVTVDIIGAGGGAALNNATGQQAFYGTGGGGAGGFTRRVLNVTPGDGLTVTINQGGLMDRFGEDCGIGAGGYSLRFHKYSGSGYLSRTPASAGSRTTWTWSSWIRVDTANTVTLLDAGSSNTSIKISNGVLTFTFSGSNVIVAPITVSGNRWVHVVLVADTTQAQTSATASDSRFRLYVNGTQITSFTSSNMLSQNIQGQVDNTTEHRIAQDTSGNGQFIGILSEINFISGQALSGASFGQTSNLTGLWIPKVYAGSYGTNGYYLDFAIDGSTSTTIGNDASTNTNNWTPVSFSRTFQTKDSPNFHMYATGGEPGLPNFTGSDAGGPGGLGVGGDVNQSGGNGSSGATGGKGHTAYGAGGTGTFGFGCGSRGMPLLGSSGRRANRGKILIYPGKGAKSIETASCVSEGNLVTIPPQVVSRDIDIVDIGEIDWRQVEVAQEGPDSLVTRGYCLEKSKDIILNDPNPQIYIGTWDGTFVKKWTQNPVWIIYDLLINTSYGLGIPEEYIDKFKFYKVAQYCDAVDPNTGKFIGVDGYSDGTFRNKPLGYVRPGNNISNLSAADLNTLRNKEAQVGLLPGTPVKERRFVCNLSLNSQRQVMDIINQVTAIFRGILIYSGGKISLNVDLPDELPVAIFNETNIIKDSFQFSGIKESELISGVEVSYMDPSNHYKKEVLRIDDAKALEELSYIENIKQVDLTGCDRRSQAFRFGQYLIASNKYIRRKTTFKTTIEALNLSIGDVISVSQRMAGIAWGYGGKVASNTASSGAKASNVLLEHFTAPAISSNTFTNNNYPLALRIINRQSEKVDLYLVNNYSLYSSGNAHASTDLVELSVNRKLNPTTRVFDTITQFNSGTDFTPSKGDIWTLGELNINNFGASLSDKLFKITNMERDSEESVTISAVEYISNVYTDSDSLINYTPIIYPTSVSVVADIPPPIINVRDTSIRKEDGLVKYDLNIDLATIGYPYSYTTELLMATAEESQLVEEEIFND